MDYYNGKDLYNEGDEEEEKILEVLKNKEDIMEVLEKDNRWPILYQLSPIRANIIEPMTINSQDSVLEIGSGMGAVTGALAKRCKTVECIELSKRRSMANAYRNSAYSNIEIIVGNFEDISFVKKYDVITLIGVLEYAQSYISSENPYHDFLKKIGELLNPGGRLYIAIENRLGLKYFAGYSEDHLGYAFAGIEGYEKEQGVRTFSHSELCKLLKGADFNSLYFYYPYPDYKLPTTIYSDDFSPSETWSVSTMNYDLDRLVCFDENKTYTSLVGSNEWKTLSNSFLVEAMRRLI